jgi:plastocyanin
MRNLGRRSEPSRMREHPVACHSDPAVAVEGSRKAFASRTKFLSHDCGIRMVTFTKVFQCHDSARALGWLCSLFLLIGLLVVHATLMAQTLTVTGRVILLAPASRGKPADNSNAVVYLTPLPGTTASPPVRSEPTSHRFQLVQKSKRFTPHLLVVPVGAVVEFPNQDPFFHNVFSLFEGKRFDLGLYEAGATRTITFNIPGVSYIFCNIHPEMSAVVIVMKYPYYAISNTSGDVTISAVPPGRYQLNIWHERCLPEALRSLSREVAFAAGSTSLGELRLRESGDLLSNHKNKYGRDYDPTVSSYSTSF